MISNNGGDIFPFFYESRLFRFFTIAEYFTSETIMALSNGNITTFSFKNKEQMKRNIFISAADVKQH